MGRPRTAWYWFVAAAVLHVGAWTTVAAQESDPPRVRIEPNRPFLGDVVTVHVGLPEADGGALRGPDTIPGLQGFRNLVRGIGPVGERRGDSNSLQYSLVALRPGYRPLPSLLIERAEAGDTTFVATRVPLGGVQVGSVLPAPGEEMGPGPVLEPTGERRGSSPVLPLSLAGTVLFAGAWAMARKGSSRSSARGPAPVAPEKPSGPALLRQLLDIESAGTGQGTPEAGVDEAAATLKQWIRLEHPSLRASHTVPELRKHLGGWTGSDEVLEVLEAADRIRFGPKPAGRGAVDAFWTEVKHWASTERGRGDSSPDRGRP